MSVALGQRRWQSQRDVRRTVYLLCLAASFALNVFIHGWQGGPLFWALASAAVAVLCLAIYAGGEAIFQGTLLRVSAGLAALLALAIPLGALHADGEALQAAIAQVTVWPQFLVLIFASRILAIDCELRFAAFWNDPLGGRRGARSQSIAAAASLGAALTLLFYQLAGIVAESATGAVAGPLVKAFLGKTVIHEIIVLLFFMIVGYIIDAAVLHLRDRRALDVLRRAVRDERDEKGPLGAQTLGRVLAGPLAGLSYLPSIRLVHEALQAAQHASTTTRARNPGYSGFHATGRRFVRAMLSFLPLFGFLGTVIGLATAIDALPQAINGNGQGPDVTGSLAGLAIKFETTLLGLLASIAAGILLAWLEKSESECTAHCLRLAEAVLSNDDQ